MKPQNCYENYPLWIVAISSMQQLAIYAIGAFIFSKLGSIWLLLYIFYVLFLEFRVFTKSCVHCYYYGKRCFTGRGLICSIFLSKGSPQSFLNRKVAFTDLIPEMMVALIPIFIGIGLLILHFDWLLLILLVISFLLTSVGNGFIRGSLACKFCKQKEVGCPAEQLLNKTEGIA